MYDWPGAPRRDILVGSIVTGEDPTAYPYGKRGEVRAILTGGIPAVAYVVVWETADRRQGTYHRGELRDVRDKPVSAQIGWTSTVWEQEEDLAKR